MAELSHGGLWIRWSSLNRRDRWDVAVSMSLFLLGGGVLGFLSGRLRGAPLEPTAGNIALAALPLLGLLLGSLIYTRFVLRQDELFRRFHMITTLWGGIATLALLVPLLLWEAVFGRPDMGFDALLIAFAIGSVSGGFWATRRYL